MKKIRLFSLLGIAVLAASLAGCKEPTQPVDNSDIEIIPIDNSDVIAYNDTLVDIASQCYSAEEAIWTAYDEWTAEDLKAAVNDTVSACENVISQLNSLEAREDDNSLRDAIIPVIEKEIEYCNTFSELADFQWADLDNLSEEEAAKYEEIGSRMDSIMEEIATVNDNLLSVQETFAAAHGYELQPEEPAE